MANRKYSDSRIVGCNWFTMKKFELHTAYFALAVAIYYIVFSLVPFSWYVNVAALEYQDICVGESIIPVHAERTMSWLHNRLGIKGDVWSQAVLFEENLKLETTIYRVSNRPDGRVEFGYEPFSTESNYSIALAEPIMHPGSYGLNEWVNIYPLPLVKVSDFIPADEARFNVVECTDESPQ